ncbi:CAT RNA binding domain-containing protein [Loigolactobacillus backii]|uniref:CAT RNA binding domain-containing protein n=1 Tax=Loigolactobacillus backii TaxID=375175 RepID=UPI0022FD50DC|nr:CAT RNA binding domain-containing protein [Loigolactobacillus backii]MDA5387685.1 hypothetical protein [Loigolactobacillus backii]MDA5390247.1 hypothetical protein [Loigolactobacillus backii]
MKIKKIFNNNVLLAEQDHHEAVLIGKGLAFQKKAVRKLMKLRLAKSMHQQKKNGLVFFEI